MRRVVYFYFSGPHGNTIIHPNQYTMESIYEQWNPEPTIDILSKSWPNITDAKKAVKTWILDRGESWTPSNKSNKVGFYYTALILPVISTFELHAKRMASLMVPLTLLIVALL
jgi:hypothetical protein